MIAENEKKLSKVSARIWKAQDSYRLIDQRDGRFGLANHAKLRGIRRYNDPVSRGLLQTSMTKDMA